MEFSGGTAFVTGGAHGLGVGMVSLLFNKAGVAIAAPVTE